MFYFKHFGYFFDKTVHNNDEYNLIILHLTKEWIIIKTVKIKREKDSQNTRDL